MGPIAFELSVLMAIYFTMGAIFLMIVRDVWKHPVPKSRKYKDYDRFMRDRFGIVVACGNHDLEKLENIVDKLESGELSLEDSIQSFEKGIELSRHCRKKLEKAEGRVKKLLEKSGEEFDLELFDDDGDNNE